MRRPAATYAALALALPAALAAAVWAPSVAGAASSAAVEAGRRLSIIGGCHDCHSAGYAESGGKLDPATALTGSPVGFQGPWGTTYAANLRIFAAQSDEAGFVTRMRELSSRPPMPYFNLASMTDEELGSLYRYIVSLGEPGAPAPAYVPPNETPTSPYVVFAPPTMPGGAN